jgi:hypothetical protein
VLESAAHGGALKTERKGVSLYQVRAVGRAAHAGLEPERGVNATVELAHQVLAVAGLGDPARGTSVTPTALSAGTTSNTVPALGSFAVDVRMWDAAEQARVDAAMRSLLPVVPDAVLQVSGGPNRSPLAAEASAELFERAGGLAALLGLAPLDRAAVGGASDGNFTAGIGTPTLDGLGAVGGGAHADDEHVRVSELPGRAALIAALIDDLLTHDRREPGGGLTGSTRRGTRISPRGSADAAAAAGVAVRELSSIDELTAVIGLFDEIWAPRGRQLPDPPQPAPGAGQVGELRGRGLRPAGRAKLLGRLRGVLRPADARGAAQPHRGRGARRARAVRRVRAEAAPAGVGAAPGSP